MLSQRLVDISQLPKGPILSASASRMPFGARAGARRVERDGEQLRDRARVSALAVERERAVRFGYSEPELTARRPRCCAAWSAPLQNVPISRRRFWPLNTRVISPWVSRCRAAVGVRRHEAADADDRPRRRARRHRCGAARGQSRRGRGGTREDERLRAAVKELQTVVAAAKDAPMQPWVVRAGRPN
jgi:hypothetical protein